MRSSLMPGIRFLKCQTPGINVIAPGYHRFRRRKRSSTLISLNPNHSKPKPPPLSQRTELPLLLHT